MFLLVILKLFFRWVLFWLKFVVSLIFLIGSGSVNDLMRLFFVVIELEIVGVCIVFVIFILLFILV